VESSCGEDAELKHEVLSLIEAESQGGAVEELMPKVGNLPDRRHRR
jgi:hypothetical protein